MNRTRNENGVILIATIMTVVFIAMLSLAMLMQSIATHRSQMNSEWGEKAFQMAEGAIDNALTEMSWDADGIDNNSNGIVDEVGESDGVVNATLAGGTYSTTVTAYPDDTFDIIATGTYNGISRTVEVSAAIFTFPNVPGAITLVNDAGNTGSQVNFAGNAFSITGTDTNPDGSAGAGADMPGIAVMDAPSVTDIQSALTQPDNVVGQGGDNSVFDVSATMPIDLPTLLRSADRFRAIADEYYPVASNRLSNAEFGTPDHPQVTVIGDELTISGRSDGAGVLIIDGDVEIRGNFSFQGLIIVTGRGNMRFGNLSANGNTNIYGGILVGSPAGSTIGDLDIRGNIDVWYSEQTLNMARAMLNVNIKKPAVVSWRRLVQ